MLRILILRSLSYILVWDVRAEDEYGRIEYWVRTIQSLGGDSPILIVANKCDRDRGRYKEIENALRDRYPQIKRIFYVSCRDNIGIDGPDGLREYIKKEAIALPLMKLPWLDTWLKVRQKLEDLSKTRKYIPYKKYLTLCWEEGIEEEEAASLVQYLHDLGILLCFRKDTLLKNIVILSPEWGTGAVYKILDEQQLTLKGRNGILYTEDLPKVWKGTLYPENTYSYLLKLMENFQLSFRVDSAKQPDTYLVAELLNVNPVKEMWPTKGERLSFRYAYGFMPAGIMTRLIVSIHRYLETTEDGTKKCWLKGAYLCHEDARAKVVLDDGIGRHYVDIEVIGENRDRGHLLSIIRDHLDEVNSRFSKIDVTRQIPCKCEVCAKGTHYYFPYEKLRQAENMGRETLPCYNSMKDISTALLLDGVEEMAGERFDWGIRGDHGDERDFYRDGHRPYIRTDTYIETVNGGGNAIGERPAVKPREPEKKGHFAKILAFVDGFNSVVNAVIAMIVIALVVAGILTLKEALGIMGG